MEASKSGSQDVKKTKFNPFEQPVRYQKSIQHNKKAVTYIRDVTSLAYGTASGILMLESIYGFLLFLIAHIVTGFIIYFSIAKGPFESERYFISPINSIFLEDLGRCLASFTMMWCLAFALVA